MNNIRVIFCIFLTMLMAALLVWGYFQNKTINDLTAECQQLKIDIRDTQITNSLLQSEVNRITEIANQHHDLTNESKESYKEALDEIKTIEETYKDWFDAECPYDLNGVLGENCRKN